MEKNQFFAIVIVIFILLLIASIVVRIAPTTAPAEPEITPEMEDELAAIDRRWAEADETTQLCEIWDDCEEFRVENREYGFVECMDHWESCVNEGYCDPIAYLLEAGKCENYTRYFDY